MASSQGKIWYINNQTNKIYKLVDTGYTMDTNERYVLLKDIETGHKWVMPQANLYRECLLDGRPIKLWEEMPDGWHPISEEKRYPGYTNNPRKVEKKDYDRYENGRWNNSRSTFIGDSYRGRIGFKRR